MRGGVRVKGKAKGRSNTIKNTAALLLNFFVCVLFFEKTNDEQNKAKSNTGVRISILFFPFSSPLLPSVFLPPGARTVCIPSPR